MAKDIKSSVRRIQNAKTDIASAIETKGVSVPDGAKIDDMPELISHIKTGGTDTSDATATADDIASGKTAYVDGEKVIGEVETLRSAGTSPEFSNGKICLPNSCKGRSLVDEDSFFYASADEFGNAAAENVLKGKTFTSAAGLAVAGTHECPAPKLHEKQITPSAAAETYYPDEGYDGISKISVVGDPELSPENIVYGKQIFDVVGSHKCPTFTTQEKTVTPSAQAQTVKPDSGYDGLSSVAVSGDNNLTPANIKKDVSIFGVTGTLDKQGGGIDTSDATAKADDIAKDKTAYVNGKKITGTAYDHLVTRDVSPVNMTVLGKKSIGLRATTSGASHIASGTSVSLSMDADKWGTAAVTDVLKGKTFTSENGVKIAGTLDPQGGGIDTSDATATANDIAYGKSAYVNGKKVNGEIKTLASAGSIPEFNNGKICLPNSGKGRSLVDENSFFYATADKFGDAAAENVAKGKTFTSAAGLAVVGTMEKNGGDNSEMWELLIDEKDVEITETVQAIVLSLPSNKRLKKVRLYMILNRSNTDPITITRIGINNVYVNLLMYSNRDKNIHTFVSAENDGFCTAMKVSTSVGLYTNVVGAQIMLTAAFNRDCDGKINIPAGFAGKYTIKAYGVYE